MGAVAKYYFVDVDASTGASMRCEPASDKDFDAQFILRSQSSEIISFRLMTHRNRWAEIDRKYAVFVILFL